MKNMMRWMITFFILTLAAGFMGFAALSGSLAQVAQFLTVIFVLMFVASIFYSIIAGRKPRVSLH